MLSFVKYSKCMFFKSRTLDWESKVGSSCLPCISKHCYVGGGYELYSIECYVTVIRVFIQVRTFSVIRGLLVLLHKPVLKTDIYCICSVQVVGRGCYGNVWMGQLIDQCAAVKQLSLNNRQNFLNERDIYRLPMMEHENIARFIDATERQLPGKAPELLIILEYYPLGSLNNFLKHKSCNWPEACRMAHSITRGLSYLHTERLYKPAIAHRDLNSRNVLVHSDGTCAISDFGMAMALSRPFSGPLEEETAAIAEVGTYRYMAPEVLDGAINLSDHQTALKQVDVYALGLMYWELFSRCSDIFSGHVAPPFSLAFEAELGSHPTFDEMQQLVARERHRPVFPASWQDDPLALAYLKLVIEECWEQDAEARITACCAEERMKELGELRPLCLSVVSSLCTAT
uniref:receptor protein serine/threonine kinase n=1 Tax=Eptatretus burgeri TaxID=7764 RepID=A0A8C4Q380_EPTBU